MNFENLSGIHWDRSRFFTPISAPGDSRRATFRFAKRLPDFVWNTASLEGNTYTFPEVVTLLEGVTVGGHKLSEQTQILNLKEASHQIISLVNANKFTLSKQTSDLIHGLTAKDEALEWGHFRGEGHETTNVSVYIGQDEPHLPPATVPGAVELKDIFARGLAELNRIQNPVERAYGYYLFASYNQFYFDGNKRTARFMMNGLLMQNGFDAVTIPVSQKQKFDEAMIHFYRSADGEKVIELFASLGEISQTHYLKSKQVEYQNPDPELNNRSQGISL